MCVPCVECSCGVLQHPDCMPIDCCVYMKVGIVVVEVSSLTVSPSIALHHLFLVVLFEIYSHHYHPFVVHSYLFIFS